eukprot:TRINITY_DN102129_c0_g1_i1.p1 TRINITY_DN102129_c0_g1~~TRINITY_DN102129_c0_g1_i1.p1  ORF type:complete len:524 (+),score=44.41 TRINITY_DN102129_c0_g1_i1:495-2066(+)
MEYFWDRYNIKDPRMDTLHWFVVVAMLVPCFVYLVGQFDAFGSTVSTLSGGAIGRVQAMVFMMLLIVLFESLGGLKAVALTDVVQGGVLMFGALCIPFFLSQVFGGLPAISSCLTSFRPEAVSLPSREQQLEWYDFSFTLSLGRALLPDLVTRCMAAKCQSTLKSTTIFICFTGLVITIPFLLLGIIGSVYHADLYSEDHGASNDVFAAVTLDIVGSGAFGSLMGPILMAASLAAIMSTADSLLIAASHIIVLDIIIVFRVETVRASGHIKDYCDSSQGSHEAKDDKQLVILSRVITFVAAALCIPIAEAGVNLTSLASLQMCSMTQVFPSFVIAMYCRSITHAGASCGLFAGLVSVALMKGIYSVPGAVLLSFALNMLVTATVSIATYEEAPSLAEDPESILHLIAWRTPQPPEAKSLDALEPTTPETATPIEEEVSAAAFSDGQDAAAQKYLNREPIHSAWYLLLLCLLFWFFAVPFYQDPAAEVQLFHGWPMWTLQSLFCWASSLLAIAVAITWGWSESV